MPEDVRRLLTEARKYRPEAVVEMLGRHFVIWRSIGMGIDCCTANCDFVVAGNGGGRGAWDDPGYGCWERGDLDRAIAESRVWPLEDARKIAELGKTPVWKCGAAACGQPTEVWNVFCAECEKANADGIVRAVAAQMKKPDPYAKHRKDETADGDVHVTAIRNRAWRSDRIAALSTSASPLDRLAARKQRQRGEALRQMDRPRTYVDRMGVERHWDGRRVVK
jgi:hypothetical protein